MRSRYRIVEPDGIYFVTSTVVEWLPAFTTALDCQILLDALAYARRERSLKLYAYVLLDNHLHLVVQGPELSRTLQAFKRYTAQSLIAAQEQGPREWLLNQLAYYKKRHKTSSQYQVWQEGLHPQLLTTDAMLQQKITYIHDNPVRRGSVELPEHWRYSSARNFMLEDHSVMELDETPL